MIFTWWMAFSTYKMFPWPALKSSDTLVGTKSALFWAVEVQQMSKSMPQWKNGEILGILKRKKWIKYTLLHQSILFIMQNRLLSNYKHTMVNPDAEFYVFGQFNHRNHTLYLRLIDVNTNINFQWNAFWSVDDDNETNKSMFHTIQNYTECVPILYVL